MYSSRVFVFGSNREGRHGKGAAKVALTKYGAIYGQAEGWQGDSYAIITKELRTNRPPVTLEEVREGVERFIQVAREHPDVEFVVTKIGCGLAGFKPEQIIPLFSSAPRNCKLPFDWVYPQSTLSRNQIFENYAQHGIVLEDEQLDKIVSK